MSMNQHELETAHFRALIDAHNLKRKVLVLDYNDECTVLARAKFNDAMERVVQIEVRGFERYGDGGKEDEDLVQECKYARLQADHV